MDGTPQRREVGSASQPIMIESDNNTLLSKERETLWICARTRVLHGPGGLWLRLTPLEARLLTYLSVHTGRDVSKPELLAKVWSYNPAVSTHTVETNIWRLRQKLKRLQDGPDLRTGADGYYLHPSLQIGGLDEGATSRNTCV